MSDDRTQPQLQDTWTGRVYRDNDPRSPGRYVTITGEPDPKTGRCPVIDNAKRVTKISTVRLFSSKYTRCPEREKTTLPEAKTTADSWGTIVGIMLCKDSRKMIARSNNEQVMVIVWDESDSGEMPPMMEKLRFEVYRDGE